jgi:hypothetical protein
MEFPTLISGELVQSSATRLAPAQHLEHYFAGYSRQSQRRTDANQLVWKLQYSALTPDEATRLRAFFEALPVGGEFDFRDPWTGVLHTDCRLATPRLELLCDKDNRYSAAMEIENAG